MCFLKKISSLGLVPVAGKVIQAVLLAQLYCLFSTLHFASTREIGSDATVNSVQAVLNILKMAVHRAVPRSMPTVQLH